MTVKLQYQPTLAEQKSLQRARWIIKGRTLLINNQIMINISKNCTVVLKSPALDLQDSDISVRFWFSSPVETAIPYLFDETTQQIRPIAPGENLSQVNPNAKTWLLEFKNRTASAIRQRFTEL